MFVVGLGNPNYHLLMTTFISRTNKDSKRAPEYFSRLHSELDMGKYSLPKYQEFINLASFQNMHDADLAYHEVYHQCAENAHSKAGLLSGLEQESKLLTQHPNAFDHDIYKKHTLNAIDEIKHQLHNGALDYLFV